MNDNPLVDQLVHGATLGTITAIDPLSHGHASLAYKIKSTDGEFIALTQKEDGIEPPDYAYNFAILKTLEEIRYKFAPKAVYINPEHSVIVMSPVAGEPVTWVNDAPEARQKQVVETLITALLDLRAANFSTCSKEYKQLTGKNLQTVTIRQSVGHYMTGWFELALAGQPDPELIKWIKPKVALCEELVRHMKSDDHKVLAHGDTSEGNIMLTRDLRLGLIDWEGSGFNQFPAGWDDFGVAYLMNHVRLFQKFRTFVISRVSEINHIANGELEEIIRRTQELIKLGDIQWAIMMNSRVASGEIKGRPEKYLAIAKERVDDYRKMFAGNSLLF